MAQIYKEIVLKQWVAALSIGASLFVTTGCGGAGDLGAGQEDSKEKQKEEADIISAHNKKNVDPGIDALKKNNAELKENSVSKKDYKDLGNAYLALEKENKNLKANSVSVREHNDLLEEHRDLEANSVSVEKHNAILVELGVLKSKNKTNPLEKTVDPDLEALKIEKAKSDIESALILKKADTIKGLVAKGMTELQAEEFIVANAKKSRLSINPEGVGASFNAGINNSGSQIAMFKEHVVEPTMRESEAIKGAISKIALPVKNEQGKRVESGVELLANKLKVAATRNLDKDNVDQDISENVNNLLKDVSKILEERECFREGNWLKKITKQKNTKQQKESVKSFQGENTGEKSVKTRELVQRLRSSIKFLKTDCEFDPESKVEDKKVEDKKVDKEKDKEKILNKYRGLFSINTLTTNYNNDVLKLENAEKKLKSLRDDLNAVTVDLEKEKGKENGDAKIIKRAGKKVKLLGETIASTTQKKDVAEKKFSEIKDLLEAAEFEAKKEFLIDYVGDLELLKLALDLPDEFKYDDNKHANEHHFKYGVQTDLILVLGPDGNKVTDKNILKEIFGENDISNINLKQAVALKTGLEKVGGVKEGYKVVVDENWDSKISKFSADDLLKIIKSSIAEVDKLLPKNEVKEQKNNLAKSRASIFGLQIQK